MRTAADELGFIARQLRSLLEFRARQEALMADVDQAVSDLVAAVDGVATRVQEDVDVLLAKIEALETASAEDKATLTAAAEAIRAQVARLQDIDPVQPEPDPDPDELEPPA